MGVAAAVVALVLALAAQLLLLGAWRLGLVVSTPEFQAVPAAPLVRAADGSWQLPAGASAGGIIASALDLRAETRPALRLRVDAHALPIEIEIAWARLGALDRPVSQRYRLEPSSEPRTHMLQLVGHRDWAGTIARLAVVVRASGASPVPLAFEPRSVAAAPGDAISWLIEEWFEARPALRGAGQPVRALPLSLWWAVGVALLALLTAGVSRWRPAAWTARFIAGQGIVLVAALVLSALIGLARVGIHPVTMLAVALVAVAVGAATRGVLAPKHQAARSRLLAWGGLAAAALVILASLGRGGVWLAAATGLAALVLLGRERLGRWTWLVPLVGFLTLLAMLAAVQGYLSWAGVEPAALPRLADPTVPLGQTAVSAWPLVGIAATSLALTVLWPGTPGAGTRLGTLLLAAAVALGVIAVAAASGVPPHGTLLAPVACWLVVAGWSRLQDPLPETASEAADEGPRTLHERSQQARALYAAAIGAMYECAARGELGEARRHLDRAAEIAADESEVLWGQVALALAQGQLSRAEPAYRALLSRVPLSDGAVSAEQMHFSLHEMAWALDDVVALERIQSTLGSAPVKARIAARCALEREGADAMWRTLEAAAFPPELAPEQIECALLRNDVEAAKAALERSGIPIDSVAGQCYVARLKLRVLGAAHAEKDIYRLATWHPELAPAEVAVGELLAAKGDVAGARVRFERARALDAAFWVPIRALVSARS